MTNADVKKIAIFLNAYMLENNISANKLILSTGLHKSVIYNILQLGRSPGGYNINSLFIVCHFLGIKLSLSIDN
jgi:hypothetical protein